MVISVLGKLPHIMLYFQICLISFFGNVFTPCLVYIPTGGVFCLLVLFPHLQWLQHLHDQPSPWGRDAFKAATPLQKSPDSVLRLESMYVWMGRLFQDTTWPIDNHVNTLPPYWLPIAVSSCTQPKCANKEAIQSHGIHQFTINTI